MRSNLDSKLMAALRGTARCRMTSWAYALAGHRQHPTFSLQENAFDRTLGFTCRCSGEEQEWNLNITELKNMLPEARELCMRVFSQFKKHGSKAKRRFAWRADVKAKALLHRELTKEQKWDLKARKAFEVVGQDGNRYLITVGYGSNVRLIEDGVPTYSLCVITKGDRLPTYDLLLAQKVLIELDIRTFLTTAKAFDLRTNESFDSAEFLLGTIPRPVVKKDRPDPRPLLVIPEEDLDNPAEWARAQIGAGHGNDEDRVGTSGQGRDQEDAQAPG